MSVPNCSDQSFGFVPQDLSLSNLRISSVLSSCKSAATSTPEVPFVSVWQSSNSPSPIPIPSLNTPIPIQYDQTVVDTAGMFAAPQTFTIPETGIYRITGTTLVGDVVSPDPFVVINNVIVVQPSNADVVGYAIGTVSLTPGQTATISGTVTVPLNAGDQVASVLNMTDLSGTSTASYYGTAYGVRFTTLTIQLLQ